MMTTNPCNYYSRSAETAQTTGKTIAEGADMINYVPCETKHEKSTNFGLRKEM